MYFLGNQSTVDAEATAAAVTAAGGTGAVLRFAMFMARDSAHMQTYASMARKGYWGLFGGDESFISFVDVDDAAAVVAAALEVPAGVYNVAEVEPVTRADHRAALAEAVGRDRLRRLPGLVEKVAGPAAESVARSHRISSAALQGASSWRPARNGIDCWRHLA